MGVRRVGWRHGGDTQAAPPPLAPSLHLFVVRPLVIVVVRVVVMPLRPASGSPGQAGQVCVVVAVAVASALAVAGGGTTGAVVLHHLPKHSTPAVAAAVAVAAVVG